MLRHYDLSRMAVLEDAVLLEKGGGGTEAAVGQGSVKASINVCITVQLSADGGMRLMPAGGGEGC